MNEGGVLYVVATPIGNLKDITLRALDVLNTVDIIACEDTRRTRVLLSHYGISKPLMSLHAHSSVKRIEEIIELIKNGKNVAYVSDAGTPSVSDPGTELVNKAYEEGIKIVPLPGPSALSTAISLSPFNPNIYIFLGFLPRKSSKRLSILSHFKDFPPNLRKGIVIFESPYRIEKLIKELHEVFGDVWVLLLRELTKRYEQVLLEKVSKLLDLDIPFKGEFTLIVYV